MELNTLKRRTPTFTSDLLYNFQLAAFSFKMELNYAQQTLRRNEFSNLHTFQFSQSRQEVGWGVGVEQNLCSQNKINTSSHKDVRKEPRAVRAVLKKTKKIVFNRINQWAPYEGMPEFRVKRRNDGQSRQPIVWDTECSITLTSQVRYDVWQHPTQITLWWRSTLSNLLSRSKSNCGNKFCQLKIFLPREREKPNQLPHMKLWTPTFTKGVSPHLPTHGKARNERFVRTGSVFHNQGWYIMFSCSYHWFAPQSSARSFFLQDRVKQAQKKL